MDNVISTSPTTATSSTAAEALTGDKVDFASIQGHDAGGDSSLHPIAKVDGQEEYQSQLDAEKATQAIRTTDLKSNGSNSSEDHIIFWDGEDDPQNPYNWPRWLKVLNCVLISGLTFITPLASCK